MLILWIATKMTKTSCKDWEHVKKDHEINYHENATENDKSLEKSENM